MSTSVPDADPRAIRVIVADDELSVELADGRRIVVVDGGLFVASLVQAYGLAAEEIDGRKDSHDAQADPKNRARRARPSRWLFSG